MKKCIKNFSGLMNRRDKELGICVKDILKYALIAIAAIGSILLLTQWIGFAAAFAVTMISVMVIAAGIFFCLEE